MALDERDALLNFALDIRFAPLRQLGGEGLKSVHPLIAAGFQSFNLLAGADDPAGLA